LSFDEKQWLIARIDNLHNLQLQSFKMMEDRYDKLYKATLSEERIYRNYGLSTVGIIMTILLGALSANPTAASQLYFYILLDLVSGLSIFLMFEIWIRFTMGIYESIDESVARAEVNITHSAGFFSKQVLDPSKIESAYLKNYFNFIIVVSASSFIDFLNPLQKISDTRLLKEELKKDTRESIEHLKELIEKGQTIYNSLETEGLPQKLLKDVESQFRKR